MRARRSPLPRVKITGEGIASLAVFTVALGLCSWRLGFRDFWLDEALSASFTGSGESLGQWLPLSSGTSWLYYVMLRAWHLVGDGDATLRFLSAIFGAVAAVATMLIGSRLAGLRTGVVAAVVLMTHPVLIQHAQEVRMYTFSTALVCLNGIVLLSAVRTASLWRWGLSGFIGVLCLGAHYFSVLAWGSQWLGALICWRRSSGWRGPALAGVIAAIGVPAHLLVFDVFGGSLTTYVAAPHPHDVLTVFLLFLGERWKLVVLTGMAVLVALVLSLVKMAREPGGAGDWRGLAWPAIWLGLPPLLLYVLSLVAGPVFINRYLMPSLPAFALVTAWAIAHTSPRWIAAALLACVLVAHGRGLQLWYQGPAREGWSDVASYIERNSRPGERMVFFRWYISSPYRRYASDPSVMPDLSPGEFGKPGMMAAPVAYVTSPERFLGVVTLSQLPEVLTGAPRIWVVLSHDTFASDTGPRTRDVLLAHFAGFRSCASEQFQAVRVQCYER